MGVKVKKLLEEQARYTRERGDRLDREAAERARQERADYERYTGEADVAYEPLIAGEGGYDPAEAEGIMQEEMLTGAMATPQDYAYTDLTPEEAAGIRGRPEERAAYFHPEEMMERHWESAAKREGLHGEMAEGLYEGISPELGLAEDYSAEMGETLGEAGAEVRGAVDPERLRTSEGALDVIRMSPEEEARIVEGAGITAGNVYRAQLGDLERRGRAAGVDPLGAGAMRTRYNRMASADAADAMTQAKIAAGGARAGRESQAEYMRQTGEMGYSGLKTGTELALSEQELAALSNEERMRLLAEQDISSRRMGAAETVGRVGIATEAGAAGQRAQQAQFSAGLGTDIATGIERDRAERDRYISAHRTGTAQQKIETEYEQGLTASEALAGRTAQVAGARLGEAAEGRGYLRSGAGLTTGREQSEYDRQANLYGTQGQLRATGTGQAMAWAQRKKPWEKVLGAVTEGVKAATPWIPGQQGG